MILLNKDGLPILSSFDDGDTEQFDFDSTSVINKVEDELEKDNILTGNASKDIEKVINQEEINNINLDSLGEADEVAPEKLYPVYIIVSYVNSTFGKLIKFWTKDEYSHAAICFEPELKKMYSFNGNKMACLNGKSGLSCESIEDYIDECHYADIQVNVIFLKKKDWSKLKERMGEYLANYKRTSYSISNIFNIMLNRAVNVSNFFTMVCSQFVDSILKFCGIDLTDGKSSNLVTPGKISRINNPKVYKIFEGKAIDYDAEMMENRVNMLIKMNKAKPIIEGVTLIFETKEFPVQFDNDGNLLISKKEKINFIEEYNKSKKLRPLYAKYRNIDALEYEAAKLWYMNMVLLKLLEDDQKNKQYIDARSKVLTEFSAYMREISKIDNTFNFTAYYNTTPFSDVTIKINKSTLKYTMEYLRALIKTFF